MKVTASIEERDVCVKVEYTVNGKEVADDFHFPFTQLVDGKKTFLFTDEAVQDLVAFVNNVQDT